MRVSAHGSKTWVFDVKVKSGVRRTHTLGKYPTISLSAAHNESKMIAVEAMQGIDRIIIMEQKRKAELEAQQRITVQQAIDLYDKDHLSTLCCQPERYRTLISTLGAHLSKPLDELTERDIEQIIAGYKSKPVRSARIRAYLKAFVNHCWSELKLIDHNPAARLKKPKPENREIVF